MPLALLYWTLDGVAFCDLWSVRRRVTRSQELGNWSAFYDDRARSNAEARYQQFQDQLRDLVDSELTPSAISANGYFKYLPPAGLLPLVDASHHQGLTVPGFFNGRSYRNPFHIEGARLFAALSDAADFPALDLTQDTMVWIYLVRENRQSLNHESSSAAAMALFLSGHLPFIGDARFDVNRWDYSNFGSLRIR
jgi:hypothetical protein